MKLLNSTSFHGWCRRFFKWVGERERDCLLMVWVGLFMGAEMVSSIVMYNLGGGPRGPYKSANLEGHQSNLLFWGSG